MTDEEALETERLCRRHYSREWRERNPDKVKAASRRWAKKRRNERRAAMTGDELERSDLHIAAYASKSNGEWRDRQRKAAKRAAANSREFIEIRAEERRRGMSPRMDTSHRGLDPISPSSLAKAKVKPRNCSDVRWRIELRRRRAVKSHNCHGVPCAPDPDRLW